MNILFSPGYMLGCYPSDMDGDIPVQISVLQLKALVLSTRPDLLKHFPRACKISILARMCLFWESLTQRKKEKLSFPGDQAGLKAMKVAKAPKIRNRSALTSARILILGSQGAGHKRSRQHPCSSGSFGRTSTVQTPQEHHYNFGRGIPFHQRDNRDGQAAGRGYHHDCKQCRKEAIHAKGGDNNPRQKQASQGPRSKDPSER